MRAFNHPTFGKIGGAPSEDGAIFRPLVWLSCPGNFRRLTHYGKRRAARAGILDGLTGRVRAARAEECGQMLVRVFIDRDYGAKLDADGKVIRPAVTEDEVGRAILGAAKYCDRANWREGSGHRQDRRKRYPLVSSMSATGDNPAAIAALAETAERQRTARAEYVREALCGADDEEKTGETYAVDGGECYPEGDGKMIATDARRTWIGRPGQYEDGTPFRFSLWYYPTGWKMDRRKAHKPSAFAPCAVADTVDTDAARPRYAGPAPLPAILRAQPGDGSGVRCRPFDWETVWAVAEANRAARNG